MIIICMLENVNAYSQVAKQLFETIRSSIGSLHLKETWPTIFASSIKSSKANHGLLEFCMFWWFLPVLRPCHFDVLFAFQLQTMDLRVVPSRTSRRSTLQSVRLKLWQKWRHASYGPDTDGQGATSGWLTFDFTGDTSATSYSWCCASLHFQEHT